MRLFSVILISLIIVSCSPQKRLNRLVAHHPELITEVIDSIRIDTIFPIPIKEANLNISETLNPFDTITKVENGIILTIWKDTTPNNSDVNNKKPTLHVRATTLPDSIPFHTKVEYVKKTIKAETKPQSFLILIALVIFLGIILIITIALIIKKIIS